MEGGIPWVSHTFGRMRLEIIHFEPLPEPTDEDSCLSVVSMDVLPDDVLERILACLPIASIVRAGYVCKRWNDIVSSRRFLCNFSSYPSQKPWYFMFTFNEDAAGFTYDPVARKWYAAFELPCIKTSNWFVSASCGLVCFMDNESFSQVFVCNPITREWSRLEEPPGGKFPDYSSLALSVNRNSHKYTAAVAKSKQVLGDFLQWDLSIHVYDSESRLWVTPLKEVLTGWRGGDECVICNGILYILIYSTGIVRNNELRHGLIMYDLSTRQSQTLMSTFVRVPCPLTCGRLMNLKDRLVMVGGIGRRDRLDIITGIGIWELVKKEWREVSRMPHRFLQGFGEFDEVFASSGADDLIYIQSYGATALLVFDMIQKLWKWSQRCPVSKKFPLQLFTGFCFEPRLEVSP